MTETSTTPPLPLREGEGGRGRPESSPEQQPHAPPPPSPRDLLRLLAWLSPAFPTGAFAYSHGLEWAVDSGDVTDGPSLQAWLHDVLAHGAGRTDTILLRHAHAAAHDPAALAHITELAIATAPSRERQSEALDQGRAFLLAAAPWRAPALPARTPYAVAVGALAGTHGIDVDDTASAYLQTFAANLISAAVRLVPLGQTTGLRVLAALEPEVLAIAAATRSATLDDLGGCAFRSDLAAMRHETQYTRLFRS
ncbi:MAG: urease accessory protein UreF [Rhodospirillales bacterium]|nr:urease accessory protein UreF [Rhodospirillales bacterium]